jgi:hypothetical protein
MILSITPKTHLYVHYCTKLICHQDLEMTERLHRYAMTIADLKSVHAEIGLALVARCTATVADARRNALVRRVRVKSPVMIERTSPAAGSIYCCRWLHPEHRQPGCNAAGLGD